MNCIYNFSCLLRFKDTIHFVVHSACFTLSTTYYDQLVSTIFNFYWLQENYGSTDLDKLEENDRVGVLRTSDGELVFYVNGVSQSVAATGLPDKVLIIIMSGKKWLQYLYFLGKQVVSTILSLILFNSFWYCGDCYTMAFLFVMSLLLEVTQWPVLTPPTQCLCFISTRPFFEQQ